MDNKQSNYDIMERYLSGDLSISERNDFEQRLEQEEDLRQELKLHQELQRSVLDKKAVEVEQKIKAIGQEFLPSNRNAKQNRPIPLWKRPMTIAAALAFLVVLTFLIKYYSNSTISAEQLYASNYTTPELLTISRSEGTKLPVSLIKAYEAYETQRYEEAIVFFSDYTKETEASIANQYYHGVCYLAKSPADPKKAITILQAVITHGDNSYVDAARWYTAMAWLKQGDKSKAKTILEEISKAGKGKYKIKAEEFLESNLMD